MMTIAGLSRRELREEMLKIKRSMDEQLQKHGIGFTTETPVISKPKKDEWEVDPLKLVVKSYLSQGAFASVFKGYLAGQEVAG